MDKTVQLILLICFFICRCRHANKDLLSQHLSRSATEMGLKPEHVVLDTYESFKNNTDRQVSFILDSLILN